MKYILLLMIMSCKTPIHNDIRTYGESGKLIDMQFWKAFSNNNLAGRIDQ